MLELEITNSKLFDSLLTINYGKNSCVDLHNDFDLKLMEYRKVDSRFILDFEGIEKSISLQLVFENINFIHFDIPLNKENLTIDNFHRGRFEYLNKLYEDYENKKCFYLEFYEEGSLSLLSSKVLLKTKTKETKIINLNDKNS